MRAKAIARGAVGRARGHVDMVKAPATEAACFIAGALAERAGYADVVVLSQFTQEPCRSKPLRSMVLWLVT